MVVDPGVTTLQQNFQQLFPGEDINVAVTDEAVILSGAVSSNDVMLRAGELAKAAMPKLSVMNMLALPSGSPSKQVMLQVRFAEVNRNALQQSGLALFANRSDVAGRSTTQTVSRARTCDGDVDHRVHRLPQYLPVLHGPRASAACSRRCRAAGSCRASPNRT